MEELQKIDPDVGMSGVDLEQLHNWGVVEPSVPIKVKDKMPGKKNPSADWRTTDTTRRSVPRTSS